MKISTPRLVSCGSQYASQISSDLGNTILERPILGMWAVLLQSIDNYCMNILASSFNVQKQDFILGDVKGSNEDNLICIQIKYYFIQCDV